MGDQQDSTIWRFANAVLDEHNHELRINGEAVPLEDKPFAVLLCLLQAEGELVTKEEIFETVWAGRVVTDGVLSQAIKRIREVLDDSDRTLLRTVHGYGFRLDVTIEADGDAPQADNHLALDVGGTLPGLSGWVLDQRLETRPSNELWRIKNESGEIGVLKLALDARAERALRREVTLNKVLLKELGENPPLVPLTGWQFERKPHWIRMPWYAAGSLADWVKSVGGAESILLQRRVNIVSEAAKAFAKAHALGVMHKDIKPGNLLVDESGEEPRLMICDFGSGTATSRSRLAQAGVTVMGFTQTLAVESHTGSGTGSTTTAGTPAYMAPELLRGGVFSERSDVYSLGVMLYQLISGEMHSPLAHGWEDDIADAGLRDIISAACAGRPEKRIAGMHELAQRLHEWKPGQFQDKPAAQASGMRLSAIMFTDIVGYSSLVRADEGIARELLDHHIATMRALLPQHQGSEVEIIGDAFLVEFPSAVLAVQCAAEFQKSQAEYNDASPAERQYRIRIGIHIGDVEWRDGKVYGHGVNYAARIEPLSPPGGLAISPQVLHAIEARLNLPFRSLGKKQLKNVAENIEIFALTEAAIRDPESVKPARTPRRWLWPMVAGVTAIAMATATYWFGQNTAAEDSGISEVDAGNERSDRVAILNFDLLGLDERTEAVMIGLQDALISDLSKAQDWELVRGGNLQELGLASATAQKLGDLLDSGRLVRGSIQQSGEALRVNMQIVDAQSGKSLWADAASGNRGDLFGLQDQIARMLAKNLGERYFEMLHKAPASTAAYEAYLEATAIWSSTYIEVGDQERVDKALALIDQALEHDPGFIEAYLAGALIASDAFEFSYLDRAPAQARVSRSRQGLRDHEASAYMIAVVEAIELAYFDENPVAAEKRMRPFRAKIVDDALLLPFYAGIVGQTDGSLDEKIALLGTAVRRQPLNVKLTSSLANALVYGGQAVAALELLRDAAERMPQQRTTFMNQYYLYGYQLIGEKRFLQAWKDSTPEGQWAGFPAWYLASVEGDRAALLKFGRSDDIPDIRGYTSQIFRPSESLRAGLLLAADAPAAEIRDMALRGSKRMADIRARSDNPVRRLIHARAMGLAGLSEEARVMVDQAMMEIPVSWSGALHDQRQIQAVLAEIYFDPPRAAARLDGLLNTAVWKNHCGEFSYPSFWHDFTRYPDTRAVVEKHCRPVVEKFRRLLKPYIDELPPAEEVATNADRVAILSFDLLGLDAQAQAVLTGLQDALIADLSRSEEWELVRGGSLKDLGLESAPSGKLGEVFDASRLIRGSVQQSGDELRANVQIVEASSGKSVWASAIPGNRNKLFDFQESIAQSLAAQLGTQKFTTQYAKPSSNEAYASYLEALAIQNGLPGWLGDAYETGTRLLEQALALDPDLIESNLLAVVTYAWGYNTIRLESAEARARVTGHIDALRRNRASAYTLAMAEALNRYFIGHSPKDGVAMLAPHEDRILRGQDYPTHFAIMYGSAGLTAKAEQILRNRLLISPADTAAAAILGYLLQFIGDGAGAKGVFDKAAAQLADGNSMTRSGLWAAYASTGDLAWLRRWASAPAARPEQGMDPALQLAQADGDRKSAVELVLGWPDVGEDHSATQHMHYPLALGKASALYALESQPGLVQKLARQSVAELAAVSEPPESAGTQMAVAFASALLGDAVDAIALMRKAQSEMPVSRDPIETMFLGTQVLMVLTIVGDEDALLAELREQLSSEFPGYACAQAGLNVSLHKARLIPEAARLIAERCEPLWARNRQAIAANGSP